MQTPGDNRIGEDAAQFLAGHTAPAGTYHLVGTDRKVRLDREDVLPATLDGHIGVYERHSPTWAERQGREEQA